MTITEAAGLLREKKISSAELAGACLRRIEKDNPRLNAFLTLTAESALAEARRSDAEIARGQYRGPLHGVPVAVKDVYCTRGVRTTCGSALFAGHVPDYDAAAVERLRDAGVVLLGKTTLHELAYGITSNNPHFGAVRNPWRTDCIPGGSSGGSGVAVAAGMALAALGTDTGGSIRIPAAFCGVVGLKPTTGRVSRYGIRPLDFTLDHAGPLTASVRDAALVLNTLAGRDPRDESSSSEPVEDYLPGDEVSIHGRRVGVPEEFFLERLDAEVEQSVRRAARLAMELGAEVIPVRLPDFGAINTVGRVILLAEASAVMEPYLEDRSRFGADVLALLDTGRLLPATDYVQAQRLRRLMQQEFRRVWREVDCLLTPTTPIPAPRLGQSEVHVGDRLEDVRLASTRLVRGFNVLGLPALSMPCGMHSSGLPIGLQLVGPPFSERRILDLGAALEDALGPALGADRAAPGRNHR